MPAGLHDRLEPVEAQLLIPGEESSLRPLLVATSAEGEDDDRPPSRIAPALWSIPALALRLQDALPWLATLDAARQTPSLRALAAMSQLVQKMILRGDYAPAPQPGVMQWAPHWSIDTQWVLAALADLVPGTLCKIGRAHV